MILSESNSNTSNALQLNLIRYAHFISFSFVVTMSRLFLNQIKGKVKVKVKVKTVLKGLDKEFH